MLDVVSSGRRVADVKHFHIFTRLSNKQLATLLHVEQAVRIVVEVIHQRTLQLQVLVAVH